MLKSIFNVSNRETFSSEFRSEAFALELPENIEEIVSSVLSEMSLSYSNLQHKKMLFIVEENFEKM